MKSRNSLDFRSPSEVWRLPLHCGCSTALTTRTQDSRTSNEQPGDSYMAARQSWLDSSDAPLINQYTEELTTFIDAMADGRIEAAELAQQEARLQKLMKEVEP